MTRSPYRRHIAICPHCWRIVKAQSLTYQQWQVAERLIAGETTAQIAKKLFVSGKTIESHRLKIFKATGVENVAGLIRWANDHGFLAVMGWDETRPT